ncbi:putative secreted protein [Propionispora sp. 2/2-37]|uniref:YjbH domain-containing protein n=1 Tax=Propionispora sp. 2/2-37 TaxID=1677858 RepID=UPI0006BB5CDD|nr:YjbH domain-containing protein [Propionispora sp. 2/2-37]CUH94540.1 putative secreted protein [Propionispora sp. 2/2-37]
MRNWLLGVAFFFLCGGYASAAPSLQGATGLIAIPSADVLGSGQAAAGYYHIGPHDHGVLTFHAAAGMEVGAAYSEQGPGGMRLQAKVSLLPEAMLTPAVALGVEDITGEQQRSWYAVASKSLPDGIRLHIGAGNGRFDGLFAGVEKRLKRVSVLPGKTFPAAALMAEYDGSSMNVGIRFMVNPAVKIDTGWRDHHTYFGLSYTY